MRHGSLSLPDELTDDENTSHRAGMAVILLRSDAHYLGMKSRDPAWSQNR
jgi:hypothetical protein